jgi:hypothetical protein
MILSLFVTKAFGGRHNQFAAAGWNQVMHFLGAGTSITSLNGLDCISGLFIGSQTELLLGGRGLEENELVQAVTWLLVRSRTTLTRLDIRLSTCHKDHIRRAECRVVCLAGQSVRVFMCGCVRIDLPPCVCPSCCSSVPLLLFICPSFCSSVPLCVHLSLFLFIRPSFCPSVPLSVHPSLSFCSSVPPSVNPSLLL